MQHLKVGILQFDQVWEDKQANFERIKALLAGCQQLDLLLLPEMFHTGFSMQIALADDWQNSTGLQFLKTIAQAYDTAIYTSLMVQDHAAFYNRGVFIEPNGTVYTYDKRKSFGLGGEDEYFKNGSSEQIVTYKNWRFNLQICYDLRFPELIRNRINQDGTVAYDVLLNVANWPQKRISHWDALLKARAIENQCYVIGCNRIGTDGNALVYNGHSQVLNMFGEHLSTPHEQVGIYVVELDHEALQMGRKALPFLKDA